MEETASILEITHSVSCAPNTTRPHFRDPISPLVSYPLFIFTQISEEQRDPFLCLKPSLYN